MRSEKVWEPLVYMNCINNPIHRLPRGTHGLTRLDDKTIEWLFNTGPEIYGAAKQWISTTGSNDIEG